MGYILMMVAKNKRPKRVKYAKPDTSDPDVQEVFRMHLEVSLKVDALLEQVRALKAAGKIGEAKKLLAHTEDIQQKLTALEQEYSIEQPRH